MQSFLFATFVAFGKFGYHPAPALNLSPHATTQQIFPRDHWCLVMMDGIFFKLFQCCHNLSMPHYSGRFTRHLLNKVSWELARSRKPWKHTRVLVFIRNLSPKCTKCSCAGSSGKRCPKDKFWCQWRPKNASTSHVYAQMLTILLPSANPRHRDLPYLNKQANVALKIPFH